MLGTLHSPFDPHRYALTVCVIESFWENKGHDAAPMIFSEVLRSRCCSSRLAPNRGGPKIGPDSHQQRAISRSTVPPARLSIARFLSRSGRTGCAYIRHLPKGDRGFESCFLQRRVRLSPDFQARKSPLRQDLVGGG